MANQLTLLPLEVLQSTPSRKDGVEHEVEENLRIYGCELIQKVGIMLRLQAVTIASGQTLLHRFYFRRSLKSFEIRTLAAAALYLASKLEEDPRRVRDMINAFHYFEVEESEDVGASTVLDAKSEKYRTLRHDIIRYERYILRELGFMASQTLVHPHRYILQYIHSLFKGISPSDIRLLSQLAWGYLNDSMRTTLCCEVQPAVIAVGSIYLAGVDMQIALPQETCWYELFDVTWEDVIKVCTRIRNLYLQPRCKYIPLIPGSNGNSAARPEDGGATTSAVYDSAPESAATGTLTELIGMPPFESAPTTEVEEEATDVSEREQSTSNIRFVTSESKLGFTASTGMEGPDEITAAEEVTAKVELSRENIVREDIEANPYRVAPIPITWDFNAVQTKRESQSDGKAAHKPSSREERIRLDHDSARSSRDRGESFRYHASERYRHSGRNKDRGHRSPQAHASHHREYDHEGSRYRSSSRSSRSYTYTDSRSSSSRRKNYSSHRRSPVRSHASHIVSKEQKPSSFDVGPADN